MRTRLLVLLTLLLTAATTPTWAQTAPSFVETSAGNPVTAEPPLARPDTAHCSVALATHFPSNDAGGAPQNYQGTLTPPASCPGPWSAVVLDQTISVSGRQFDRSAGITIGGTTVYFGTTAEPSGPTPISYHVETDVTRYSALLRTPQPFSGGIGNYTSSVYTGVFDQSVTLTYYRADATHPAAAVPDAVVGSAPIDVGPGSPTATLTLNGLPRNITRAVVELNIKGNNCDEQWFDAVPDALSAAYPDAGLCGHGPYREADVGLDGTPAGSVGTFGYIYTGGIVPTLWKPVPAIGTFGFTPEQLDVTPFVGRLVDGRSHTLTVTISDIGDTWNVIPTLLIWTDHGATHTSGALTQDSVGPDPVRTTLHGLSGATVTAARSDVTAGWVQTSTGRISTTVTRTRSYRNDVTLADGGLIQAVTQSDTGAQSVTQTKGGVVTGERHTYDYPLRVNTSAAAYVDDQNFSLTGAVTMTRGLTDSVLAGTAWRQASGSRETVISSGSLTRTAGVTTGSDGASFTQYVGVGGSGAPYVKAIRTEHGQVV